MDKRIAFWLENGGISATDLSAPQHGNPGVGGTEYQFALLAHHLISLNGQGFEITFFVEQAQLLPEGIRVVEASNLMEACTQADLEEIDFLIFRPRRDIPEDFGLMKLHKTKLIPWLHITPKREYLDLLSKNTQIQRVIFVGDDQRMRAIDHNVYQKSSTIFNSSTGNYETYEGVKENLVVYLGALVQRKGFHILAKAWADVRKQIPDAQLYVLGSGALYDRQQKLGPLALAEETYEEKFVKLLGGKEAIHRNGVHFLGNLGPEKNQIMIKSKVGVVNPSGLTENCPMSVVELYQTGIPVVSSKKYGLRDMVIHGETGFLGQSHRDLSRFIVKFLDESTNSNLFGKNGIEFAKKKFSPMVIAEEWNSIFDGNFNKNCQIRGYWVHKLFSRIKQWHLLPDSFPMVEDQKIYIANLRHKLWTSLR